VPAAAAMVRTAEQFDPDPRQAATYDSLFDLYASLYPRLRGAFSRLAAVQSSA
jgi:sugar (pentulose or hexulose) kinase